MRNLTARDLGRPFIYFLTINEKFYKISFLSQILAMVIFCFPPISMKGKASNICKTSAYRAVKMTNKLSYMHKGCTFGKSAFSTLLTFYFISCEVGRRTEPSSIHLNSRPYHSDTRCMTRILKKFIDLCEQTTGNKERLGSI